MDTLFHRLLKLLNYYLRDTQMHWCSSQKRLDFVTANNDLKFFWLGELWLWNFFFLYGFVVLFDQEANFDVFWIWTLLGRIQFLCQTILCQVFNKLTWGNLQTITVWILGNFSQKLLVISENSLMITLHKQIGSEFFWDSVHRWRGSVRLLLSSMSSFSKAAVTLLE